MKRIKCTTTNKCAVTIEHDLLINPSTCLISKTQNGLVILFGASNHFYIECD